MKLRYFVTIPLKKLFYGTLCTHHAGKANKYGTRFPHLLNYHRDKSHYYYYKAFGEMPPKKGVTQNG